MRHRFHSICPYFAMFPEIFVEKHLAASRFSGFVFDPFCGRGTTVFAALLKGRRAAGCDINPVAACITGAKCDPPTLDNLELRINELEYNYEPPPAEAMTEELSEFFSLCFHPDTYSQLRYLRNKLRWQTDVVDRFIAAVSLGALHGESHRSPNYFSNRMPRTISTKPAYSVRWWRERGYKPPFRDTFTILRRMVVYRYRTPPAGHRGRVALEDARAAGDRFHDLAGKVTDVITSPPYLDTTNYREDQWLRLWLLGDIATSGHKRGDARHYNKYSYWRFIEEAWQGLSPLLASEARFVIRIGGRRMQKEEMLTSLLQTLSAGLDRTVRPADEGVTTLIKRTQANSFRGARASPTVEHDFCFLIT